MPPLAGRKKGVRLVKSHPLKFKNEILLVASILLAKISFEFWVFMSGFRSMGPDDFSKILISQEWSQAPFFVLLPHVWLPLEFWTLGVALRIWSNPYFVSLLINSLFSVLAIIMLYRLAKLIFGQKVGLMSIIIAIFFPWVVWLSISCPGESMSHFAAFSGLFCLFKWRQSENNGYLFVSSLSFLMFAMLRHYGWFFSFLFSIYVIWQMVFDRRRCDNRKYLFLAALVPWVFPLVWLSLNYVRSGSVFHFLKWYPQYLSRIGAKPMPLQPLLVRIFKYPFYVFITSPVISTLSLLSLSYSLRKRSDNLLLYLFFILGYLFLSILWGIRSGTSTEFYPQRYVVIPVMLLIPLISHMISIFASSKRRMLAMALFTLVVAWNFFSSLSYPKWDPSLERLGIYLYQIWNDRQLDAEEKVLLVEDAQFDGFPIKVFSRHASNILFDRPYYRSKNSVLLQEAQEIDLFLQENNIKMIAVQNSALIKRIPPDFRFLACISGYKLFCSKEYEGALRQRVERVVRSKRNGDISATFGNKIELIGYSLPRDKFPKYGILHWRLLANSTVDYEFSIQFVNVEDRTVQFCTTALPVSGVLQNTRLGADTFGEDRVRYSLPPECPSGKYLLTVSVTRSDSIQLPIVSSTAPGLLGKREVSLASNYIVFPSKKEFIAQFVRGENRDVKLFLTILLSLLS